MKKKYVLFGLFTFLMFTTQVFAAGGGHGANHLPVTFGEWAIFLAPVFNLSLLLIILVWKIKGPLHQYFVSKSEEISNTLDRVQLKSKEAQLMLDSEKKKMSHLENEIQSLHQNAEKEIDVFDKKIANEHSEKVLKLKKDAELKIKEEQRALIAKLNTELLNSVIFKAKSTIKERKDYQEKVSTKLLKQL